MTTAHSPVTHGTVAPGFESVRQAFVENFERRGELGGACCAFHDGVKVVDLWGGVRNASTGEPWQEDTMVLVYSATKGLAAMTLALAHSRGWLDYEARVADYWPEFAAHGKEDITVRQLLAHQAGLFAIEESVDRAVVADPDRLAAVLARQRPSWPPGEREGYHGLTIGFYEGELTRRLDPAHRTLGQFFRDEIAARLDPDVHIRLPPSIPDERLATLAPPRLISLFRGIGLPWRLLLASRNPRSNIYRALGINPGTEIVRDRAHVYARDLEVPAGGGVASARAIARAYSVFAGEGRELALRPDTLAALAAPAVPPARGFHDECLLSDDVQYSLGFTKPSTFWPFGSPQAFGALGAGGSMGFADPGARIGYGYVTSRMGTALRGDPRDIALRRALYTSLGRRPVE